MHTHTHTHLPPNLWCMISSLLWAIKVPWCNINGCFSIAAWKDLIINHPLESKTFFLSRDDMEAFYCDSLIFLPLAENLMTVWEKCTQPAVVLCWTLICVWNVSSQNQGLSVFIAAAAAPSTHSVKVTQQVFWPVDPNGVRVKATVTYRNVINIHAQH